MHCTNYRITMYKCISMKSDHNHHKMSYDAYLLPSAMAEFDIIHGSPSSKASPKKHKIK